MKKIHKTVVIIFTLLVISMQNFSASSVDSIPYQNQTPPTENQQNTDDQTPAEPEIRSETNKNDQNKAEIMEKRMPDLARIAIIPMQDRTGTENFQYLSESLSEAIHSSMQKNFLYAQIDSLEVKKAIFDLEQEALAVEKESNARKNFFLDIFRPRRKPKSVERIQLEKTQKLAKKLNADIVIYGNYIFDEKSNEMVISTSLYFGLINAIRPISDMRNPVDNTIFTTTDKAAKAIIVEIDLMVVSFEKNHPEIVEKIETKMDEKAASAEVLTEKTSTAFAVESSVEDEKAVSEINVESAENDSIIEEPPKKTLTKEMARETTGKPIEEEPIEMTEIAPGWETKKMSLSLLPGFYINKTSASGFCGTCDMQLGLAGRYWIFSRLYMGSKIDLAEIWSEKVAPGSLALLDGFATVGYSISHKRFLFSADLGMGYYFAPGKTRIDNPTFGVSASAEYLLSRSFSIGLSANAQMYYDQPNPLNFVGLGLMLNYNL
ncbi:MAG: hypothetical protein OEV66_00635 [Spirochaetia bacterium]|nr:hypothetical protein [Spirochaetia bacterium]